MLFVNQVRLEDIHEQVFLSHLTNSTSNGSIPRCGIPYDELRCSVLQSTNDQNSNHCAPDKSLKCRRISLLVVMTMDI